MMPDSFANKLLQWYDCHGRHDLPWHHNRNAYRVWVSEIMLQQTQVTTVIPYFEAFMERFPDVHALAEAPVDDVLSHWSGLGYYARARNLQKAAQTVVREFDGEFPQTQEELESLTGIGRSTAAAILAQAFGIPAFPVDTHVHRLAARWGLSRGQNVERTERDLKAVFPREDWNRLHLQIIYFGRAECPARGHDLEACAICGWAATRKRILLESRRS